MNRPRMFGGLALGITLAVFGNALPAMVPSALAQELFWDLNGIWELDDYGGLLQPDKPLVRITQTGRTVRADFISGAACSDGTARDYAFTGEVTVGIPGESFLLSATSMWVCSGTPPLVHGCESLSMTYESKFSNATVVRDSIKGERFKQTVLDCRGQLESSPSSPFTLTRMSPCVVEERAVAQAMDALRTFVSSLRVSRPSFRAALEAAYARYGDTFNGQPTTTLAYPYELLGGDYAVRPDYWDDPYMEALVQALPGLVEGDQWNQARVMAEDMGLLQEPPLPAAVRMLEEMSRIEGMVPEARQISAEINRADEALQTCRNASSSNPGRR